MSYQLKKIDGAWHIGKDAAAEMCGVSTVTFDKWLDAPSPPPFNHTVSMAPLTALGDWIGRERLFKTGRGGGYPFLPDISRLPGNRGKAPTAADDQKEQHNLVKHEEEARYTKIRADKAEVELREMMGELVRADEIEEATRRLIVRVKTKLLGIPMSIARLVADENDVYAVQETLTTSITDALEDLSSEDDNVDAGV